MHSIRVAMTFAALAASTGAAFAEPFWLYDRNATTPMTPGRAYVGVIASGGVQQMPTFNGTATLLRGLGAGAPVIFSSKFDADVRGVEPGGVIGYMFPDGALPSWLGQRFRVEISGSVTSMHRETDATFDGGLALNRVTIPGVGGRALAGSNAVFGLFAEHFDFRREAFTIRLKASSDFALGPNLSFSPAVSVFGGRVTDSYEVSYTIQSGVGPGQLNERLSSREYGGSLSGNFAWQFADGFALNFGGHAGIVRMRTELNGSDCLAFVAVPGPCGASNATATSSVTDSRSVFGFRGGASMSLSADMRFAIATVGGYFQYDSRIPSVENPQVTTSTAFTVNTPARVKFGSGFGYGGFLALRIPFVGL